MCRPLWTNAAQHVEPLTVLIELISPSVLSDPLQQICQAMCCENQSSISNPPGINNVSHGKRGSRRDHRAVHSPGLRSPHPSTVLISDLCRNLEAFFGPRLEVSARKFGELTSLKLLAASQCRRLVSQPCQIRA